MQRVGLPNEPSRAGQRGATSNGHNDLRRHRESDTPWRWTPGRHPATCAMTSKPPPPKARTTCRELSRGCFSAKQKGTQSPPDPPAAS